ncbi:carboxymuconolactone decarboxylase family protein [Streptomyces longwoodensis]|uniref:carboxymuconolactone decarboxylase family protein n=1 Tax=Streptomyces longwoodensis TaxID=68231 RepID=UPI0037AA2EFA
MARIPYPHNLAVREALADLPVILNVFKMIAHAPAAVRPTVDLGLALLSGTALDARLREAVILATATRAGCTYEWVQHEPIAARSGLSVQQIAFLKEGAVQVPGLTQCEETCLRAVSELSSKNSVDEETLSLLRRQLSDRQIIELLMTVGYYTLLANVLNSLDVEADQSSSAIIAAIESNRRSNDDL